MERIAIIADDLTGASDTGIQFRKHGLETLVIVDHQNLEAGDAGKPVWSVNADTRSLPPAEAYGRVYAVAKKLKELGFKRIYKKLDSTLRGHPGRELEAVMDALSADLAVVVPAFPANGRVVIGGRLFLESSASPGEEEAREGSAPGRAGWDVPRLLQENMSRRVGTVPVATVRRGGEGLARAMEALRREGKEVLVLDAAAEEDLAEIARTCTLLKDEVVVAGAAGLAAHLPFAWGLVPPPSPSVEPGGAILLVAGSRNPVTAEQVVRAVKAYRAPFVEVDTAAVATGGRAEAVEKAVAAAQGWLQGAEPVSLLVVAVDSLGREEGSGPAPSEEGSPLSKAVAECLAEITRRLVAGRRVCSLVITGGDTAVHICRALGAKGIDLMRELLPGIPLGKLLGGVGDGLPVVTKAGGFGPPEAFVRVAAHLRDRPAAGKAGEGKGVEVR
ncbi:MAG TPA: Hrp-dependent type III effector protein [Peptococcaceae bacterium]|nr:MAG: Type III effector Hrp-dependent outer [Moorella sp. 60_41]HBT47617.1 Hrp-dependent type III effector protein [Peptococcaceae bacterium]